MRITRHFIEKNQSLAGKLGGRVKWLSKFSLGMDVSDGCNSSVDIS